MWLEDAQERVGQDLGQNGQQGQPRGGQGMGQHHRGPVADPIHKTHRSQIHQQLEAEIERDQQGDPGQGNVVAALEGQKQQGYKVIHNSLDDVGCEAGVNCFLIGVFHGAVLLAVRSALHYITPGERNPAQ